MYKIKFLQRIDTGAKGNKADRKYHTVSLDDSEIESYGKNWRSTGMKEISEIELKDAKLNITDIIELFYPDGSDKEDMETKKNLLEKYSKHKDSDELEEKRQRAKELGIKGYQMMKEETLDAKITEKS